MTISRNQPLTADDKARPAPSALAREVCYGMSQCYTYSPFFAEVVFSPIFSPPNSP